MDKLQHMPLSAHNFHSINFH